MKQKTLAITINAILTRAFAHNKGRPSKTDEVQIDRELRSYFLNSISPYVTSQKTGYDLKTVYRYYDKFTAEMSEYATPEFLKRCREEKERCFLSYDRMLVSLYEDKEDVTLLIEEARNHGNIPLVDKLYKTKLKINELIGHYHTAKLELVTLPTADIESNLKKRGDKNEN